MTTKPNTPTLLIELSDSELSQISGGVGFGNDLLNMDDVVGESTENEILPKKTVTVWGYISSANMQAGAS